MEYLNIPEIEYYKINIRYSDEIKEDAKTSRDLKKILSMDSIKKNVIVTEKNINDEVVETNINSIIYGEYINYNKWLLNISKESFGFITLDMLNEYDKELKSIYKVITIDNKFNMTYNHKMINNLIRKAFYDKRKMTIIKEEVPESASILSISDIPTIDLVNKELQYPANEIVNSILNRDKNGNKKINLEELSKEQLLELVKSNPKALINENNDDILELKMKDKTFHYIPYVFSQSSFEKNFLEKILSLHRFVSNDLEVYYNGDHNIASFRIECYKTEDKILKKVGLYTPDFLIIRRDNDNKIDKVLIIETKGKGFKEQSEFIDRRNYIEKEFIKLNNKKFGYNKFDYLYIEDTLTDNEIINKLNDKLYEFLKEEK